MTYILKVNKALIINFQIYLKIMSNNFGTGIDKNSRFIGANDKYLISYLVIEPIELTMGMLKEKVCCMSKQ